MIYNDSCGIDHSYSNVICQKLLTRTKRRILNIIVASKKDAFLIHILMGNTENTSQFI